MHSSETRWGILGTARIGRQLIRGIGRSGNSCVHAVASRERTRALEMAKECGVPRFFGSYEDMIESGEVDVIYNPLPNGLHSEWTIKALEAGLPVLCEKPFTVNAAEARAVAETSERTGCLVAEAFMYRYHPLYDKVLEMIHHGDIGEIVTLRSVFAFQLTDMNDIRKSTALAGGALMDVGCYCVNFSRRIAESEPLRVSAIERRTSVDDTLVGQMEFPNGILAEFKCSIESYPRSFAEIVGTEGIITIETPWVPGERNSEFILRKGDKQETVTVAGCDCYQAEVEDFVDAYRNQRDVRWPIDDAVANMEVIDALYESARKGTAIPLEN